MFGAIRWRRFQDFSLREMGGLLRDSQHILIFTQGAAVTDDRKIVAFIQTWMYFGLLSEVVGRAIDFSLFKQQTETGDVVLFVHAPGSDHQ